MSATKISQLASGSASWFVPAVAFLAVTAVELTNLVAASSAVLAVPPAAADAAIPAVSLAGILCRVAAIFTDDLQGIILEFMVILLVFGLSAKFFATRRKAKIAPDIGDSPKIGLQKPAASGTPSSRNKKQPEVRQQHQQQQQQQQQKQNQKQQAISREAPGGECQLNDYIGGDCQKLEASAAHTAEAGLLIAGVRKGMIFKITQLLDASYDKALAQANGDGGTRVAEEKARQDMLLVFRSCVSMRKFQLAVQAFEHNAGRVGDGSNRLWSLLLYCAIESKSYGHCRVVIPRLSQQLEQLTENDVTNMLRFYAHERDLPSTESLLAGICSQGRVLSAVSRNHAVRACACEECLEVTEAVLYTQAFEKLNSSNYNSALKSLMGKGFFDCCLQLHKHMGQQGVQPTLETFGILMDVYIKAGLVDRLQEIFKQLCESGQVVNTVHLTTYIKGLLNGGRMDAAVEVLQFMQSGPAESKPDIVTYHTFVKARAEQGDIVGALETLDDVVRNGFAPDTAMLDSLFASGCAKGLHYTTMVGLFDKLVSLGLQPAHSQLTLVLKAFISAAAWQEALDFLERSQEHIISSEGTSDRIYGLLGLACAHAKNREMAEKICRAMIEVGGGSSLQRSEFSSGQVLESWVAAAGEDFGSSHKHDPRPRLEQFISLNRLDGRCVQDLSCLSNAQLEWIMDRKFVLGVKPSGKTTAEVLSDTITLAKAAHTENYPSLCDIRRRLSTFVQFNNLDSSCTELLKRLPEEHARWVMDQEFAVDVDSSRGSASAKVVGRVGRVRHATVKGFNITAAVSKFIAINHLDENCAGYLRSLPVLDVIWVMDHEFRIVVNASKGTASAKVTGLINKVKSFPR